MAKIKLPRWLDRKALLPLGVIAALCVVALFVLEESAGRASAGARELIRGVQRGILRSFLLTLASVGLARFILGAAIGGPAFWIITAGAFVTSGGWNLVAGPLKLPELGGGGGGGNGGECGPGSDPNSPVCLGF
jgi:hypothetical protein